METLLPNIDTHPIFWKPSSPWSGKSMEDNVANPWNFRMWIGPFEDNFWMPLFEQQFISKTIWIWDLWCIIFGKQLDSLSGKEKSWSDRNLWHKPDQFPTFEVGIDKLIAQSSLSTCHCQGLCLLWLCALLGKNGKRSCWILDEANSLVFRKRLLQRIESNSWTTYGIRVEDSHRTHYNRNTQSDSTDDGRIAVWTRELHFTGRIIFMSMFDDIVWDAEGNADFCVNDSKTIEEYAERFPRCHWSFLVPGSEKKWCGNYDGKPDGSWTRTAEIMLQNFKNSGHPIIRYSDCTSSLERGQLRSKGGGKTTIHFNGSAENIELPLQMLISANQFSLYGAVADMIAELFVDQRPQVKPLHQVSWMNKKFLHNLLSENCKPMESDGETHWKNMRNNDFRDCQKTGSYPHHAPQQVWD